MNIDIAIIEPQARVETPLLEAEEGVGTLLMKARSQRGIQDSPRRHSKQRRAQPGTLGVVGWV